MLKGGATSSSKCLSNGTETVSHNSGKSMKNMLAIAITQLSGPHPIAMDILPCSMVSYIFQSFLTREIHAYLKLAREGCIRG